MSQLISQHEPLSGASVQERIAALLEGSVKLPPLPASGLELMNILRQPSESINVQRISALVENDPTLAANLLRVANSPAYGTVRTVNRVSQAVMVLGLDETVQMLNYYLLKKLFPRVPRLDHFSAELFWQHAWGVANAARVLGQPQYLVGALPGELYLAGLLHDIGKVMLAIYLTDDFQGCLDEAHATGAPLHVVEQARLGTTHAQVGAQLLDAWHIPPQILAAVGGHHDPSSIRPEQRELVSIVELANVLAHQAGVGQSGNPIPPDLADSWLYREGRSPLAQPGAESGILAQIVQQLQTKAAALQAKDAGDQSQPARTAATSPAPDKPSPVTVTPEAATAAAQRGVVGWFKRMLGK